VGPQSLSGRLGGGRHIFLLPGIKLKFLSSRTHSDVTVRLHYPVPAVGLGHT
jgi:hypothetical protein